MKSPPSLFTKVKNALRYLSRRYQSCLATYRPGSKSLPKTPGYDARKAAQLAAFFVAKGDRSISKLKLAKLLYLSERQCAEDWGLPMFFDRYYSIKDGPICTNALSGIDGKADREIWQPLVQLTNNRTVILSHGAPIEDLSELSQADIEIANKIWNRFGAMTPTEIREWTHRNLPEYQETQTGRVEITPQDMARGIGLASPNDFAQAVAEIRSMREDDPFA